MRDLIIFCSGVISGIVVILLGLYIGSKMVRGDIWNVPVRHLNNDEEPGGDGERFDLPVLGESAYGIDDEEEALREEKE